MDYETLNILYHSRKTLLKLLAARGYNTAPYDTFGPVEISLMAKMNQQEVFMMDLERTEESLAAAPSPIKFCRVLYAFGRIKARIAGFLAETLQIGEGGVDPTTTEVIVITLEPIVDAFHTAALTNYRGENKLRLSFFQAHTLVNNPLDHILVPKHELLQPSEHDAFLAAHKIKSKRNLPHIKFHEDIIARILGAVPDDIVKITRPSPQAGEYVVYRVCTV